MIIVFKFVQQNLYFCDWMFKSRLWVPKYDCELDYSLNFDQWNNPGQNIVGNSTLLDARVITASALQKSAYELITVYKVLDIGYSGSISNAHIFINASITHSSVFKNNIVQIYPFGSVLGQLDNVSISGCVNISSSLVNVSELMFSRMFGSVFGDAVNYPPEHNEEFQFRNVSSSLRFFLNGIEITANTIINNTLITIENGIDQPVNITVNQYQLNDDTNMHHFTYELTDKVSGQQNIITAWFAFPLNFGLNNNINALNDLYPFSLQMSLDKYYETKGMTLRRFNVNGFEVEYPYYHVDFVIYQDNTKSVAIEDQQIIICSGDKIFDIKTKSCISRDQCYAIPDQLLFQATCVLLCPMNFVVFNKSCYQECPRWLGSFISGNVCAQAQNGKFASKFASVNICPIFTFKLGCYEYCPHGTNIQGHTCVEPVQLSQCASNEYFVPCSLIEQLFQQVCGRRLIELRGLFYVINFVETKQCQACQYFHFAPNKNNANNE
ncbi:Hypothetical_protein [Hexamita inflata]|uniref:Hypothetical_protein n=1 Tax=Hexamita inflata TaxID=28002 RepID=A0AA86PL76_9EUKA|nr:Hypothetical protein HINF_LOCUS29031 [Hexamita inflata]